MSSAEGFTKLLESGEEAEQEEGPVKSLLRQISSSSQQSLQVWKLYFYVYQLPNHFFLFFFFFFFLL
jgi:hypothetical protein